MSDREFIGFEQLGDRELAKSDFVVKLIIVVVVTAATYVYCKTYPEKCLEKLI